MAAPSTFILFSAGRGARLSSVRRWEAWTAARYSSNQGSSARGCTPPEGRSRRPTREKKEVSSEWNVMSTATLGSRSASTTTPGSMQSATGRKCLSAVRTRSVARGSGMRSRTLWASRRTPAWRNSSQKRSQSDSP